MGITTPPHDMITARDALAGTRCWIVSDGKAGDEAQCLGVAERLGLAPDIRRVSPRKPFVWLMPWGGIDPREAPHRLASPIAPPFPDLAIASGRRTASYLRAVKAASGGKTFTVFLKDPRCGNATADFLWVPAHDRLRGPNVLTTLTSPHRFSPERLASATISPPHGLDRLPTPRVALVIGGNSAHFRFPPEVIADLSAKINQLAASGVSLMATASRRTPPDLAAAIAAIVRKAGGFYWDGTGENPYPAMLALADALVVTADSVNMVGEAAATGRPVLLFRPEGGSAKIDAFLSGLSAAGVTRPFTGAMEHYHYAPVDSTSAIAVALASRYIGHRRARNL